MTQQFIGLVDYFVDDLTEEIPLFTMDKNETELGNFLMQSIMKTGIKLITKPPVGKLVSESKNKEEQDYKDVISINKMLDKLHEDVYKLENNGATKEDIEKLKRNTILKIFREYPNIMDNVFGNPDEKIIFK